LDLDPSFARAWLLDLDLDHPRPPPVAGFLDLLPVLELDLCLNLDLDLEPCLDLGLDLDLDLDLTGERFEPDLGLGLSSFSCVRLPLFRESPLSGWSRSLFLRVISDLLAAVTPLKSGWHIETVSS
jgi:hypothetical protein